MNADDVFEKGPDGNYIIPPPPAPEPDPAAETREWWARQTQSPWHGAAAAMTAGVAAENLEPEPPALDEIHVRDWGQHRERFLKTQFAPGTVTASGSSWQRTPAPAVNPRHNVWIREDRTAYADGHDPRTHAQGGVRRPNQGGLIV